MRQHRVLLVDDHRVFTELLSFALNSQSDLRCVGTARTGRAAIEFADTVPFDTAVLAVTLPDGCGIRLVQLLRAEHPEARFVALSDSVTPEQLADFTGAKVPLLAKSDSVAAILATLREAESGASTLGPAPTGSPRLTTREREVLELLSDGFCPQTVARLLRMSIHTCRGHIKALLSKTGTRSQLEAVATARREGLLDPLADHPHGFSPTARIAESAP